MVKINKNASTLKQMKPVQRTQTEALSYSQLVLKEMFNGDPTFGTGQNLPKINGTLTSGGGLIKNGDLGETSKIFGF